MLEVGFRAARASDAHAAARLVRASFPPDLHPYLPYCQRRAGYFLAHHVEERGGNSSPVIAQVAVVGDDRVVGYAELRLAGPVTATLTYLATGAAYRGRGVAKGLIAALRAQRPSLRSVEIDVFATNQPALKLYEALGAHTKRTTGWWVRPAMLEPQDIDPVALDRASAADDLARHGFCQVVCQTGGERWTIDMPSRSVVRLREPLTPAKLGAVPQIQKFAPVTELLLISEDPPSMFDDWRRVLRAHRLAMPWQQVVGATP